MPPKIMNRTAFSLLLLCLTACAALSAEPRQLDDYRWEGVERIVAIGDLHGDYDNYIETLRLAGLIDKRGRWAGGTSHLVQTGDIPDRGPETLKIMEHIDRLAEQAEKNGGRVHRLIGNHEAMNVYGDLRYVTGEEFADLADGRSRALRDRYFELVMQDLQTRDPEGFAALPENYREAWDAAHPLGWVEHRQAWDPAWNPEGEYALRTLGLKVAIEINDTLFVHGGISDVYADVSLAELTERVRSALRNFNYDEPGPVADECGPLWYRGLAGVAPEADAETVASILERLGASRMVVGHTPTSGVIWPRFNGRVVQIDSGISEHYGGYPAYLEVTQLGLFAGYPGGRLALPASDEDRLVYLDGVSGLDADKPGPIELRKTLVSPEQALVEAPGVEEELPGAAETPVPAADPCTRRQQADSTAAF